MSPIEIITVNLSREQLNSEISAIIRKELMAFKSEDSQPTYAEVYLCRKDVARILQVDPSTVTNWRNAGILSSYQIGGRVYYKQSEILQSLKMIKIGS